MFDRFDDSARRVLQVAVDEAAAVGDDAMATEHLLLALATADQGTGRLLTEAGADPAEIRRACARSGRGPGRRPDQESLLGTLGIDLAEIRRRAHDTFGTQAVTRAARRNRPRRPRRPLWTWVSCSKPYAGARCDSPLAGRTIELIPRVKRLLERATRTARPELASPMHLLLALVAADEPACELLEGMGVNRLELAAAVRRAITQHGTGGKRAS
jgi:ATP-dependent Clp protease ATP-binding subunit ClpA